MSATVVDAVSAPSSNVTEAAIEKSLPSTEHQATDDDLLVGWDGPSDPANPLNWPLWQKWSITILTSCGGLITLMSGAMLAPALGPIGSSLNISQSTAGLVLSIYVLAFAFGPMILAPCSEVWGRRYIWIFGCIWYILWNTLCGISKGPGLMIAARFLAGFGASAEFAVSGPIVADCFSPEDRGKSNAVRSILPLMGPAIGPVIGGVMIQKVDWRWLFWAISIAAATILCLLALLLPETRPQTILSRKAARMRKALGRPYYSEWDLESPTLGHRLKMALLRPGRFLVTQPLIQVLSLTNAYCFGIIYLVISTYSSLWTDRYHQSSEMSGLHYFANLTGYLLALLVEGFVLDRVWVSLTKKNNGLTAPEYRVPVIIPGILLQPVGLLLYGWSAQRRLPWIVPDVGVAIFGFGYILAIGASQAYMTDSFLNHTASAGAASRFISSLFAFAFPIFAPDLYSTLGYGPGNTLLAGIIFLLGIPSQWVLWKQGAQLREMGKKHLR